MQVYLHKKFEKQYRKLPKVLRDKTDSVLKLFYVDPFDPKLKNHALSGNLIGKRAVSVTGDVRIIFEEHNDHTVVLMLNIGKHSRVY